MPQTGSSSSVHPSFPPHTPDLKISIPNTVAIQALSYVLLSIPQTGLYAVSHCIDGS